MYILLYFKKRLTKHALKKINLQTDQFLKIFEVMAGRIGIEVQHVRIMYQGKTYRHDQLEVKKPITDIAANPRPNFIMVSRLPGGI